MIPPCIKTGKLGNIDEVKCDLLNAIVVKKGQKSDLVTNLGKGAIL